MYKWYLCYVTKNGNTKNVKKGTCKECAEWLGVHYTTIIKAYHNKSLILGKYFVDREKL